MMTSRSVCAQDAHREWLYGYARILAIKAAAQKKNFESFGVVASQQTTHITHTHRSPIFLKQLACVSVVGVTLLPGWEGYVNNPGIKVAYVTVICPSCQQLVSFQTTADVLREIIRNGNIILNYRLGSAA